MCDLPVSYTPEEANDLLHQSISEGKLQHEAILLVSKKTGRHYEAIKKYYQCHGGDSSKRHGHCKLTIVEEDIVL